MSDRLEKIYSELWANCRERGFAGHDPFDGLSSRVFGLTPLKWSYMGRLAWLQVIKRSPFDLRGLLMVQKGVNAKAAALFALAEMSRERAAAGRHRENAVEQLEKLLELRIPMGEAAGRSASAFGYNFDWQSKHFFAPKGTPAIVPTAFASLAMYEGFQMSGDTRYRDLVAEIANFVLGHLNRPEETEDEVCFSYTPGDNTVIYNASLLAGECLARASELGAGPELAETALRTARFACRRQNENGSWFYGANEGQFWVDNFHTAYVILSLERIGAVAGFDAELKGSIERGMSYWLEHFFLPDGTPKYYDNSVYPIDIHAAAAAVEGLAELRHRHPLALEMSERVCAWTIDNMRGEDGSFYYQRRKHRVNRTPFMRWGQAWMAYAIARLIESLPHQK